MGLDSWQGNGLPSQRSLVDLRGCAATLQLRQGANFYGRQQYGILVNMRKHEPVYFLGDRSCYRRPSGRKTPCYFEIFKSKKIKYRNLLEVSPGKFRASSRGNTEGASLIYKDWA